MIKARTLAVTLLTLALAATAQASWYDDYDAGLIAAKKGSWATVAQKMSAAIKDQPKENSRLRTYGMDFRNYRPYYYRGVANLNLGKYEQAISDLEQTGGPGPENLGDVTTLLERAKKMAAASAEPEPAPVLPTRPAVTTPPPVSEIFQDMMDADVKRALELYFAGEFEDATQLFEDLTAKMPNNGWIYAFLGASQYSLYAFEADDNYRKAALESFRKAKRLRTWNGGLPQKYFSRRIRDAFREQG